MGRLSVIAFLAAAARVILSAPTPPQILVVEPSSGPVCVRFNSPVCNALGGQGYNYATFPNPIAPAYLPNAQKAESEANAVIQQALASRCSKYVVEFMCFAYFPLCDPNNTRAPPVMPCRSLCERVRSDCEPVLNATYGTRWPQWANCENIANAVTQNHADELCFGKALADTILTEATTTQPATTATTTQPATTATTAAHQSAPQRPLCRSCNPVQVTPEAFKLRNYTFAAKVQIKSKSTADKVITYGAEVLQYSPLQQQCSSNSSVRLPPKTVIISMTANGQCAPCFDLKPGQIYLVGGSTSQQDKSGVWLVPNQADVVAPWMNQYTQKWVQMTAKSDKCQLDPVHV